MKKSTEIREEINLKLQEMEDLVKLHETEKRDMSDDEKTKYEDGEAEIKTLKEDETRATSIEEMRLKAAADSKDGKDSNPKPANPKLTLEQRARKDFRIIDFIGEAREGRLTGLNKELHEAAKKEARGFNMSVQNMGIPSWVLKREKRDMTAGTDTEGGFAVATETKGILDFLEDNLTVKAAGADFQTGLIGNVEWPREDNSLIATFKTENATLDESDPTLDLITMTPKRLGTFIDLSNQLNIQTAPAIEARVRQRLGGALARGIDKAAIQGSGSGANPEGILNTTGIGAVVAGDPDGATIVWEDIVNLVREVDVDNALLGSLSYLSNPLVRAKLQTTEKATNTAQFILAEANSQLNGFNAFYSNHVPSDGTKGSGTNLSSIIFGNFNDLVIGQWGGMDILVNPFTKGKEGITEMIATMYTDVAVLRAISFAALTDAVT